MLGRRARWRTGWSRSLTSVRAGKVDGHKTPSEHELLGWYITVVPHFLCSCLSTSRYPLFTSLCASPPGFLAQRIRIRTYVAHGMGGGHQGAQLRRLCTGHYTCDDQLSYVWDILPLDFLSYNQCLKRRRNSSVTGKAYFTLSQEYTFST